MRILVRAERVQLEDAYTLVMLSDTLATIVAHDGTRVAAYFGFECYEKMLAFQPTLVEQGLTAVCRRAVYLSTAWEIEVVGCNTEIVVKFYNGQCIAPQQICRSHSLD